MSATDIEVHERYDRIIREQFENLPQHAHTWLEQIKREARRTFNHMAFPHRKLEDWRYTSVDKLLKHAFIPAQPRVHSDIDTSRLIQPIAGLESYRLIFIDNRFRIDLSMMEALPEGLSVHSLFQAEEQQADNVFSMLRSSNIHNKNSFTALNSALLSDGIAIQLEPGLKLDKPLELVFLVSPHSASVCSTPRVLVKLSEGSSASLIEHYCGSGRHTYFQNVVEEISLDAHAAMKHYRLVEENDQAFHLCSANIKLNENSQYKRFDIQLGGGWIRSDIEVDYGGRGGESELFGFYSVDHGQQNDVHTNVLHRVPGCRSSQYYKGLLLGKGRAVFDGKIIVDRDAQETDASLSNHNLMLADDAEVNTRPQLVINADNVRCSHGTTVGQLEPEQLFYLRSRGIDEQDAVRMLCQGYAADILAECEIEALRNYVEAALQSLPGMNH